MAKVLLAAWACDPCKGSEQAVGWEWLNAIRRNNAVWVITADFQRDSIKRAVKDRPAEFRDVWFHYVPSKPWHYTQPNRFWEFCERSIAKPIMHWSYKLWQWDAYNLACDLHASVHFDLAHQLTFVGFRFPGHLWKLGIPFVWGPIGGLENTPWNLLPSMGIRGAVYYGARNFVNSMHRSLLQQPRKALAAAGPGVIAATGGIRREIRRIYGVNSEVICEVGLPSETAPKFLLRLTGEPLQLAWSGRLLPGKALHLLLRAMANVADIIDWRLHIYGDGPLKAAWQRLAVKANLGPRVVWHGHVSRSEALAGLRSAHLFVTTSLKDLTSTVVLEALAEGVPVLCPDHCGFPDVVDRTCGVRLPIGTAAEFKRALAEAIIRLAGDESERRRLAAGALVRAPQFGLSAKAEAIESVYRRVLESYNTHSLSLNSAGQGSARH
jgi:glycosyltransferase involved in cell wall biosynthesis